MKKSEEVRRFAFEIALHSDSDALKEGMAQKARKFVDYGYDLYHSSRQGGKSPSTKKFIKWRRGPVCWTFWP